MEIHIKTIGVVLIALAVGHLIFPNYFNWKEELKSLNLINYQIMIVHTFFIALTVFLMGLLCLTSATDLLETKLGKTIAIGLGIFWLARLFIQFFYYSSKVWKGKAFETIIHILFSLLWTYISGVFIWIAVHRR